MSLRFQTLKNDLNTATEESNAASTRVRGPFGSLPKDPFNISSSAPIIHVPTSFASGSGWTPKWWPRETQSPLTTSYFNQSVDDSAFYVSEDAFEPMLPSPKLRTTRTRSNPALYTPSRYAPPGSAPLLDSEVFTFDIPHDELDFACTGDEARNSYIPEPPRTRGWSSPHSPLATMFLVNTPHVHLQNFFAEKDERSAASNNFLTPRHLTSFGGSCDTTRRDGAAARVSNKWGQNPPAGYI